MVNFGDFFENLKLEVKQCYQIGQFYWTKIEKVNFDNEWTKFIKNPKNGQFGEFLLLKFTVK